MQKGVYLLGILEGVGCVAVALIVWACCVFEAHRIRLSGPGQAARTRCRMARGGEGMRGGYGTEMLRWPCCCFVALSNYKGIVRQRRTLFARATNIVLAPFTGREEAN